MITQMPVAACHFFFTVFQMFVLVLPEKQEAFMKLVMQSRVRRDLAWACTMHDILILGNLPLLTPFSRSSQN